MSPWNMLYADDIVISAETDSQSIEKSIPQKPENIHALVVTRESAPIQYTAILVINGCIKKSRMQILPIITQT